MREREHVGVRARNAKIACFAVANLHHDVLAVVLDINKSKRSTPRIANVIDILRPSYRYHFQLVAKCLDHQFLGLSATVTTGPNEIRALREPDDALELATVIIAIAEAVAFQND